MAAKGWVTGRGRALWGAGREGSQRWHGGTSQPIYERQDGIPHDPNYTQQNKLLKMIFEKCK